MAGDSKSIIDNLQSGSEEALIQSLSNLLEVCSLGDSFKATLIGLPQIITLLQKSTKYSEESLKSVESFFISVLRHLPGHSSNSRYLEAIRELVNLDCPLYQSYLQDTRAGSWDPSQEIDQSWRSTLEAGSKIDAVKIDPKYDCKSWAGASIEKIVDDDLHIHFEEDTEEYDRVIARNSHEIKKYREESSKDLWRDDLKVGTLIDCLDNSGTWHNSVIVDIRKIIQEKITLTEVKVGFRCYVPYSEKKDEKGPYRGWSSSFDEWIPLRSPRLAPFGLNGRAWTIPRENFNEEEIIQDCNDLLETSPNSFCVTRPKKSSSILLLNTLNKAGKEGLFENILKTLEQSPSFETVHGLVVFIGKIYGLLHKRFAMNFVIPFKDSVFKTLKDSPVSYYRDYSKEKLDQIFDHFENLLKRVFTIQQKNKIIDEYLLDFSMKNLETPYLEKRIYGIRVISEAAGKANTVRLRAMKSKDLSRWVKANKVLEVIFGDDCHDQIVQRSGELLKLLANEDSLTLEDVDLIWTASQKNEDLRKVVYSVLIESSSSLKQDILSRVIDKVGELHPSKLLQEEVNLVYELTKIPSRAGSANVKACDFFHLVVLQAEDYSDICKGHCLEAYCNMLKNWDKSKNRPLVIESCVENIRENKNSIHAIRMILKLLTTFPVAYCTKDMPTRNSIAQKMINEQGVVSALIDNFQLLKAKDFKDAKYLEEVTERLNFLKVLITESYTLKVTEKQLNVLWDLLYRDSGIVESTIFIKWLKDTTESQVNGKKIFEDADIDKFFKEKIGNLDNDFSVYSLEEFAIFKNCFISTNLSTHKMSRLYSNLNQSTAEVAPDFDYLIHTNPIDLQGMSSLRKLILTSQTPEVKTQSSELLYEIYNHSNASDQKPMRKELLSFLLSTLNSSSSDHKKRSLEILKRFSEECEKSGTSLKSPHCALLKGENYKLTIINSITYSNFMSSEVPKKFELIVKSNTTVWQLRTLIGKQVRCLFDQFKIFRSLATSVEILDRENGKTLYNLRIRPSENLTLFKRGSFRPKAPLLAPDGQLAPAAKRIFSKWFWKFADKGDKMSAEGAAEFTSSCTGENLKGSDKKMTDFIANYDDDNDGLLNESNFLEFYRVSCINKSHAVWNNLSFHNYRNDLMGYDDDVEALVDQSSLPSNLLSENPENFNLIFEQLSSEELAKEAWELVCKLPTSPEVLDLVKNIDEKTDVATWNRIFSHEFSYKLLYVLQVVQSFLQDDDNLDFQRNRKWKVLFVKTGGVSVLLNRLTSFQGKLNSLQKVCIESIVKIVSVFILSAFVRPDILETVQLVRKESENFEVLDEELLEKKVKNLEKEGKEENSSLGLSTLSEDIFKEGLSEALLTSVDFQSLMNNLLSLMFSLITSEGLDPEDKSILDSALELCISCILHKNNLLSYLYNFSASFSSFLTLSLTKPRVEGIRKSFSQAYLSICKKVIYQGSPVPFFLTTLLKSIENPSDLVDSSQLYDLLTNLIEIDRLSPTQDYLNLGKFFLKQIFSIPYKECKSKTQADPVLVGVLKVANKIFQSFLEYRVQVVDFDLIDLIFTEILFPSKSDSFELNYNEKNLEVEDQLKPPKAKSRESRRAAYNLLSTLTLCNEDWSRRVVEHLLNVKKRLGSYDVWNYSPSASQRSLHGYAGIFNYSSICYMNSVLQQFFMIPQFRYSILSADDGEEADVSEVPEWFLKKTSSEKCLDNNLLHQLQHLYGFLELTDKQAYRPAGFCFAYKDYSGEPVNTSIQQDAQEFINFFLERLDKCLSSTLYKNLVSNTFKGKISNQIICNECRNVTERLEDFYNISLDVKHSKTIHESFSKFISGDTISGFNCESCQKQVDIKKRSLLHTLPNFMIVHLQRMVFNFDTMENEKINSRLEFPQDLNVFPYSTEGVDQSTAPEDYSYDLQGIIVHMGTAQAGHYYSFIKDGKRWLEFNDSTIKGFNPQLIESQCFGGTTDNDNFVRIERESSPNAYMLVYQKRVGKKQVEIALDSDGTAWTSREFDDVKKYVPDWIFREVLKENSEFLFEKNVFSFDFFEFLFSSLANAKYLFDVSRVAVDFSFDVVAHAYHNKSISSLIELISECFNIYPESQTYFFALFLKDNGEKVLKYLLRSSEMVVRQSIADLIFTGLKLNSSQDFSESSPVKTMVNLLLSFIPIELSKFSSKYEQYWYLFSKLTSLEAFNLYLLEKGALSAFIDFYLGSDSPLSKPSESSSNNTTWNTNFRYLVICIYQFHLFIQKSSYIFSENDQKCVTHPEFYIRSIKKNYDEKSLNFLIQFWAKSDSNFSSKIAEVLLSGLNELEVEDQESFYKTLSAFLDIDDEFCGKIYLDLRIQWVFGLPVPIFSNKTFNIEFCAAAIHAIDEEVFSYPSFLNFAGFDVKPSVCSLIWSQRKRWDGACVLSINWLLDLCMSSDKLFKYLQRLPPPTYQFSSYFHWVQTHVRNYKSLNNSKRDLSHSACLEKLEKLVPTENSINYIIADTASCSELIKFESENLVVKQINYKCLINQTLPNGRTNDAVPYLKLYGEKDREWPENPNKTFQESECIVVLAVLNKAKEAKQVWLEFLKRLENSFLPLSGFSAKISADSEKSIISLLKIDPKLPWEDLSFEIKEEKAVETVKKVMVDNYNDNLDIFELEDISISTIDSFIPAPSGQISCPACTLFNDASSLKCTICGTTLPKHN